MSKTNESQGSAMVPGLAVLGLFLVAIASVALAVLATIKGSFVGGGVCLIAAAFSFGIVAHVSMR